MPQASDPIRFFPDLTFGLLIDAPGFQARKFNPGAWARLAKRASIKYLVSNIARPELYVAFKAEDLETLNLSADPGRMERVRKQPGVVAVAGQQARTLVHRLVSTVAVGGDVVLSVVPDQSGELPSAAVALIEEVGEWMAVNFEVIQGVKPLEPRIEGRWAYTQREGARYAIWLAPGDTIAAEVEIPRFQPPPGGRVFLIGARGSSAIRWTQTPGGVKVSIPEGTRALLPCRYAFAFRAQAIGTR